MSAFVVSHDHIDALITAGLRPHPGMQGYTLSWNGEAEIGNYDRRELTRETANAVGQMLTDACVRSVAYRYPDSDSLPGTFTPNGEPDWQAEYAYPAALSAYLSMHLAPVQVLKLIDCFEYQSCEHPLWESDEAARFCEALRGRMIGCLPGYEEAAWEWTHPESVPELARASRR